MCHGEVAEVAAGPWKNPEEAAILQRTCLNSALLLEKWFLKKPELFWKNSQLCVKHGGGSVMTWAIMGWKINSEVQQSLAQVNVRESVHQLKKELLLLHMSLHLRLRNTKLDDDDFEAPKEIFIPAEQGLVHSSAPSHVDTYLKSLLRRLQTKTHLQNKTHHHMNVNIHTCCSLQFNITSVNVLHSCHWWCHRCQRRSKAGTVVIKHIEMRSHFINAH